MNFAFMLFVVNLNTNTEKKKNNIFFQIELMTKMAQKQRAKQLVEERSITYWV